LWTFAGTRAAPTSSYHSWSCYLFDRPSFYEHATFYSETTRRFERDPEATLTIEPLSPFFGGPVVALIDQHCVSSCEGIAMAVKRLPRGRVVGFHGTFGSFGMSGGSVKLPGGMTLEYPNGQSTDANGIVQLDSDASLEGGVTPNVRVPVTIETMKAAFRDKNDVVLA
jgi:carboxyl-terminal processing protease